MKFQENGTHSPRERHLTLDKMNQILELTNKDLKASITITMK